jgi:hypothetical protein
MILLLIPGHWIWVAIWWGILLLGGVGLGSAVQWGRETHWRNLDEILRGAGTVAVSVGMLLLLYRRLPAFAIALLVVALVLFVAAFIAGKRVPEPRREPP